MNFTIPHKAWDKVINDEYYYIRLEDAQVVYGNIFDDGKTGIEWQCSFKEFLEGTHEVNTRIQEVFGILQIKEITLAIHSILKKKLKHQGKRKLS